MSDVVCDSIPAVCCSFPALSMHFGLEVNKQLHSVKPGMSIRSLPRPRSGAVNKAHPAVCCCFLVVQYSCTVCNKPI